jgi:vibriolysin
MVLQIEQFTATSEPEAHPFVQVNVPPNYKMVGGGAFDNYTEPGNMLTASYPISSTSWFAAGKDHEISSPATITAYLLAIFDPLDEWDVVISSSTSDPAPHPQAVVSVTAGYTLTCGGAFVNYQGAGNILTASFPNSDTSWYAQSKDHDVSDPATITAYAIGIKHKVISLVNHIEQSATGSVAPHPTAQVCLNDSSYTLSGGGAIDNWSGAGNLLTATYPQGSCWIANGKDHIDPSPASITVYAIGIRGV